MYSLVEVKGRNFDPQMDQDWNLLLRIDNLLVSLFPPHFKTLDSRILDLNYFVRNISVRV